MLLNTAFPAGLICYMSKEKTEQFLLTPFQTPVEPFKWLMDFLLLLVFWGGGVGCIRGWLVWGFFWCGWFFFFPCIFGVGFVVDFFLLLWECVPTEWMTSVPSL